jgi:hypothetical protein
VSAPMVRGGEFLVSKTSYSFNIADASEEHALSGFVVIWMESPSPLASSDAAEKFRKGSPFSSHLARHRAPGSASEGTNIQRTVEVTW